MKNILVIGNGYDMAHGLKTSYGDFLDFIKKYNKQDYDVPGDIQDEFGSLIKENPFIQYLLSYQETLNTWVDFENELRRITYTIRDSFDTIPAKLDRWNEIFENKMEKLEVKVLDQFQIFSETQKASRPDKRRMDSEYYDSVYKVHWDKIKTKLRNDLDGLKRALILYLKYYMPLLSTTDMCIKQLRDIEPQYVITFNYTDTYRRYGINNDQTKVLHIHGDLLSEEIVLGYDDDDERDLTLIAFKKYFQRIQYQLKRIDKDEFISYENVSSKDAIAHVYGMSLDKTDEDIIKEIYDLSWQMVIYYRVKETGDMSDYENKVINLIDILGEKAFLSALDDGRIQFKLIENEVI